MTFKQYKISVLQNPKSEKLDFQSDGREHYVYRITDYTRTEKQHYYGSHTPTKGKKYSSLEEEFWTYKTSSKYNVLNENAKNNYKLKILKVFDNPADKMIYESYLHQYFDVKLHNSFWNEGNQTAFGFDTTGKKVTHSVETIAKIKKMRSIQVFSTETLKKLSVSNNNYKKKYGYGKKAYEVEVYNNHNQLMFSSKGSLKTDCERYGLCYGAIRRSYINKTKLYPKLSGVKKSLQKFQGYYAILVKGGENVS